MVAQLSLLADRMPAATISRMTPLEWSKAWRWKPAARTQRAMRLPIQERPSTKPTVSPDCRCSLLYRLHLLVDAFSPCLWHERLPDILRRFPIGIGVRLHDRHALALQGIDELLVIGDVLLLDLF